MGRMKVFDRIRAAYGKDATNLRKNSLSRAIYQEYRNLEIASKLMNTEGLFRTIRAEQNYSLHQTYQVATNNLPYYDQEPETIVNLNTYLYISEMTSRAIKHCQIHNARLALAMSTRKDCRDGDC
jgi:hypothetical protein